MSTTSTSDSLKANLLSFMEHENRPFAFADIHSRLGKHLQKQSLQKCLESQVGKQRILEKTYGKLKVYCINNKSSRINNETLRNDLKDLDDATLKHSKSMASLQVQIKSIEVRLKKSAEEVPLAVLQAQHSKLTESVNKLQSRADAVKQRVGATLDPKEFELLEQARDKFQREFGKRKQVCLRLIDGIMEGYTKPKQKLIADSEIVTDEAAGFDINRYK